MLKRTGTLVVLAALMLGMAGAPAARAADQATDRKAAEQAADKRIAELNRKMDEFAAEARREGGKARDEINRLYDEFKHKQGSASKDLDELRKATNESWDKVKVQMDRSIDELNRLYERAKTSGKDKEAAPEKK